MPELHYRKCLEMTRDNERLAMIMMWSVVKAFDPHNSGPWGLWFSSRMEQMQMNTEELFSVSVLEEVS